MKTEDKWYSINELDQLDTPALVIYPERVSANIGLLKTMVPDAGLLRPHVKTNKSVGVISLMQQQGIQQFKCATIAEAEMLGMCHAQDVLLAYQPSEVKLKRFIKLITTYTQTHFACLVDNLETAQMIGAAAVQNDIKAAVYIDLNVGMNRTGIKPAQAFELYVQLFAMPGIELSGLHVYDGHIKEVDVEQREAHLHLDFAPVEILRNMLQLHGYGYPLLVAGGSPTSILHSKGINVQPSPGTFVFWDKSYRDTIPEQPFLFAALVVCRIISLPNETRICVDLGYKSIACENELQQRVYFLNAPNLQPVGHSEEHMVIEAGEGHAYKIGDVLYAVPFHICPTVAMYDQAYTVVENSLHEVWPVTARARQITV